MMTRIFKTVYLCLYMSFTFVQASDKPNIVVLFADDMGIGEVKSLNPERGKILTTNIDQLARTGITFTDAHTASSVCTPSRYALLTGRYAWRTRLQSGVTTGYADPLIADDQLTLAKMLKTEGYRTAISGKWHLNFNYYFEGKKLLKPKNKQSPPINSYIPDGPISRGFDEYFGFHHARDMQTLIHNDRVIEHINVVDMLPRTTEYAVDFINKNASNAKNGKPFFLYMAFGSPHTPIVPSKEWIGKSGLGKYGDFVMMTDAMVGKIVDAIDKAGLSKDTLIIFSSDNGTSKAADVKSLIEQGHYPSAHLRGLKSDLWEGGHRVPFILRWPAKQGNGNRIQKGLIGLTDVFATLADILEVKLDHHQGEDSISFYPLIKGEDAQSARHAIVHHSIYGKFSIRQGNWKLLLAPGSGGWSTPNDKQAKQQKMPKVQLYNLSTDVSERTNIAQQYPAKVTELINLLKDYVNNGRSTQGPILKNDTQVDIWKDNL
ncbi:sulfatase family protein [Gayadomonas joobiniege]|uniref:sulfatase family protein n=1 Tax=Gayadomonas joobiniege TaxID=1234606 RepID=UPI001ED9917B|nr:arylsulfatase [Gayadomonas joobiniege]